MAEPLVESFIKLAKKAVGPVVFKMGTVKSVDTDQCTCDVEMLDGTANRLAVTMRAVIDGNDTGLVFFPKANSQVLVGVIDNNINNCYVAMLSEIDSFKMVIGDNKLSADKDKLTAKWKKWQFNDGSNDGLVKVKELTTKLNNLEKRVNNHVLLYNTHTHLCAAPGTASAVPASIDGDSLTLTTQPDIEDTNVTH